MLYLGIHWDPARFAVIVTTDLAEVDDWLKDKPEPQPYMPDEPDDFVTLFSRKQPFFDSDSLRLLRDMRSKGVVFTGNLADSPQFRLRR